MLTAKTVRSIGEIPAPAWNALSDVGCNPFIAHAWLAALEASGCVGVGSDWQPRHLTLWRGKELMAAAPAYLKDSSDGDFSRDWGWADAAIRARLPYYPKLVIGVPFTPVAGQRFLIRPGESIAQCRAALLDAALALARDEGGGVLQLLYCQALEAQAAEAAGWARRIDFQYHWRNDNYRDLDHFWSRFDSKRRNQLRRERRAPAEQGIALRTVRGDEIARDPLSWARLVHRLHRSTVDKLMWGRRWLNQKFYEQLFSTFPEPLEVVVAERAGSVIAGAFNVATPTHLYGRYWGCLEEHRHLHFNVCFYHSIDECIRRGLQVFEGGAGGEHKLTRGFEPVETYSAHAFLDPRLQAPLRAHIAEETAQRQQALADWQARSPILKPADTGINRSYH
ncbi:MAG: GNAT family N-acetyltransferase [Gammaproteobacteria bacterium]|nr:GNAT family N-acetyltransferase [Gammaproteobacteria bacterium]